MLRIFSAILIVVFFALPLNANQSLIFNCPLEIKDVKITLSNLTKVQSAMGSMGNMSGGMDSMGSMSNSSGGTGPFSANDEQRLVFMMKSKNITTQNVSNIYWESCYTNKNKETIVKQFKSSKKIKANGEETIKEAVSLDSKSSPATAKIGIHILKIEYDDKTSWENKPVSGEIPYVYIDVKFDK